MVIWSIVLLLAVALIGIPFSMAPTGTTAALGGVAGCLALVGVLLARISPVLTAAVAFGLVEELVALLQAGKPPDLLPALLLGVVIYLLLAVSAFATHFHGVAIDASVWRMKARYWGWTAALGGLTGLSVGLLAVTGARPFAGPLLLHGLAVVAAVVVVGAVLGAIRAWRQEGGAL